MEEDGVVLVEQVGQGCSGPGDAHVDPGSGQVEVAGGGEGRGLEELALPQLCGVRGGFVGGLVAPCRRTTADALVGSLGVEDQVVGIQQALQLPEILGPVAGSEPPRQGLPLAFLLAVGLRMPGLELTIPTPMRCSRASKVE